MRYRETKGEKAPEIYLANAARSDDWGFRPRRARR